MNSDNGLKKEKKTTPPESHDDVDYMELLASKENEIEILEKKNDALQQQANRLKGENSKLREFERLENNVKKLKDENENFKKEISTLKDDNAGLQDENSELMDELESIKNSFDSNRIIDQINENIDSKLASFKKEFLKAYATTEKANADIRSYVTSPKENFKLEVALNNGGHRIIVSHPLTKDYVIIDKLDANNVLDFIKKHLPQPDKHAADDGVPSSKKQFDKAKTESAQEESKTLKSTSTVTSNKIGAIEIWQSDKNHTSQKKLLAGAPVTIKCKIQFSNLQRFDPSKLADEQFGIGMIVRDTTTFRNIAQERKTSNFIPDTNEYEESFDIENPVQGKYIVILQGIAPILGWSNDEKVEFEVIA
jgi:hypothetical protein